MALLKPANVIRYNKEKIIDQKLKDFNFNDLFNHIAEKIDNNYKTSNYIRISFNSICELLNVDKEIFQSNQYYIIKKIETCIQSLGYGFDIKGDNDCVIIISW